VAKIEKLVESPRRGGKDGGGIGGDDYNTAAIRASLRVFLTTSAALKAWGVIQMRLLGGQRFVGPIPWCEEP
jgi:hypothetical protein